MKKVEKSVEGICPECGKKLVYGDSEVSNGGYFYDVWCSKCDWGGTEWYNLVYDALYATEGLNED